MQGLHLILALASTLAINIPFGYMRAKYKLQGNRIMWFLAIHAPVPLVFILRRLAGAGTSLIPLFVAAFFFGQFSGGLLYNTWNNRGPSTCMDSEDLPLGGEDTFGVNVGEEEAGKRLQALRGKCATCKYWRPHVVYNWIGFCDKHGIITFDDDTCPQYEPLEIKDDEFYWCSTCKTRITGVEARKYVRLGYRVHRGAFVEPDIKEELYSVF